MCQEFLKEKCADARREDMLDAHTFT
jgi:hypothetical protein